MILFFDLSLLEQVTKNDPAYIVEGLRKCYLRKYIPKNAFEKYKPIPGLRGGTSYLLNADELFRNKADTVHKAQYIRLAGRRDYVLYKTYKKASLNLSLFPDLNLNSIKSNPLLSIRDGEIHFKYEETKNGNII